MEKYVFYQDKTNASMCNLVAWEQQQAIGCVPIRYAIVPITEDAVVSLIELFKFDKFMFADVIEEELNNNPLTIYNS